MAGRYEEFEIFCRFLERVKSLYKYVIVIAGNHELTLDNTQSIDAASKGKVEEKFKLREMLQKHCVYLEDEEVEIFGIRIYGTPW